MWFQTVVGQDCTYVETIFFHGFQVKHVEELGTKLDYITPARIFFSNLRALDRQCYC